MSREQTYTGFVLKRTDYGETDQIITLFSKEDGKLRCLVKAAKLPTSKLQPALQPLFKVSVTLAGNGGLPKVIGAQVLQTYAGFYHEHDKLKCWYLISELLIKALGDGSPNETLWELVAEYLRFLDEEDLSTAQINLSTSQFQIKAMAALGMGIKIIQDRGEPVWFSISAGGFQTHDSGVDAVKVTPADYALFCQLAEQGFAAVLGQEAESAPLTRLVNQFVTYQLERELKAAQFIS